MSHRASNGEKTDTSKRVLVLGIDGATFDIIVPMTNSGRLPNFKRLMEEGTWGVLESTIPPVTIPAWASMMTGKNPGRLGYFDLLKRDGYSVEPNGRCYLTQDPIWQILNRHGIKTGVMNLPGTYPAEEVDGFMVTGMLTPSKRGPYTYPATLGDDLDVHVKEYEIDVPQWQYFDEDTFIKDLYKVTEKREKAAEYLVRRFPCEFYAIVFTCSDRIQHVMWDKRDVVEAYWEELDRVVGRILELLGEDTTVFVVSDHGFGPLERTFFVNEWLKRKRFLRVKRKARERTLIKLGRIVEKAYHFLGKRKLVRPAVSLINMIVGYDWLQKYTFAYLSKERLEDRVDWDSTRAFSCVHTPHFGQIYLNMAGEMPEGCLTEEEREGVRDAILEEFAKLSRSRRFRRPRVEVRKAEDVYFGPHLGEAPDILLVIDGGRCEFDATVGGGRLFTKGASMTGWKGTHTMEGVFIAKGPGIKPGLKVKKASMVDVTPTILRVFGILRQQDMDGRVLDEIFTEEAVYSELEAKPVPLREKEEEIDLEDEEKALIEARLRKLGYIS